MSDFRLSQDELHTICRKMETSIDAVRTRADQGSGSDIGVADFGGNDYSDVARQYIRFIDQGIRDLLGGYAAAGQSMSGKLASTLGGYLDADEQAGQVLGAVRGDH